MPEKFNYPFKEEVGDKISVGREFEIRELGNDYVMKMINPENDPDTQKHLNSEEYMNSLKLDYKKLKEIFGDNLVDTYFVQGHNKQTGDLVYYIVQKRIKGKTLEQAWKEGDSKKDFIQANKEQMTKLLWKNKKVLLTFGAPIDFTPDNIIVDKNTGKFILIDTGSPIESGRNIFHNSDSEKRKYYAERAMKKINNAKKWQSYLELSDEEITKLNKSFGIDGKIYQEQVERINNLTEIK